MSLLQMNKMLSYVTTAVDPCVGAPTISTCVITRVVTGECSLETWLTFRITVTLSGSLGSSWELRYYYCFLSSSSCTPVYVGPPQTGLYKNFEEDFTAQSGGTNIGTYYANGKVQVVPVGETDVCDELSASQYTNYNTMHCE